MAELTTEHVFDGSPQAVFDAIRQYQKYPDYIPGVTKIAVLPADKPKSTCQVRYELKLIKSFHYTMNMFEENPAKIWWDLADSNIMKRSTGSWTLKEVSPGKTKAVYALDIAFSGLVPQKIVDGITKANLPGMMKGFQQIIDDMKKKA